MAPVRIELGRGRETGVSRGGRIGKTEGFPSVRYRVDDLNFEYEKFSCIIISMTPEERELLQRAVELSEENNEILRSMRRSMKIARIMNIVYWVFIIGSAVGAFYLIQPYIDAVMSAYGNASNNLNSILGS